MTHLDIILPFYNGSKFIREQLNSIQENDISDLKINLIIVNDASSESETKFLKSILPTNHIYIENQKNLGVIKSVEYGLKASISKYIMLCDQDDVWLPTKIKKFCVLRSPHIDKDSREHFEIRIYKRFIDITTTSPAILDLLLKTELPSGVSCSLKILESKVN